MQAPTSLLIGTNSVPSDAEAVEIRHVLRDRRYRLSSLVETTSSSSGSQMVSSFHKPHDALQGEVAALLAILSPSRRLSPVSVSIVAYLLYDGCMMVK